MIDAAKTTSLRASDFIVGRRKGAAGVKVDKDMEFL